MKNRMSVFAILVIATLLFLTGCTSTTNTSGEKEAPQITTYKTALCGCCGIWAKYAEKEGFDVDVVTLNSVDSKKEELGVLPELASCHTSVVDGYVVEGHIPIEVVNKLLEERPDIKGIAMPGMPSGSPGMPGPKTEDWTIYAINHDGTKEVYMVI